MRSSCAACCAALILLLAGAASAQTPGAPPAAASRLDADQADALVRARWFEGIPEERIAPLSIGAVAHLDALLRDADEARQHAACIELLGRAGGPGAFAALASYARRVPQGEVSGAIYRARMALALAWGELAREDARAVGPLLALARSGGGPLGWRYRHLDGAELAALQRRLARAALQRSGRRGPEVDAVLAAGVPR